MAHDKDFEDFVDQMMGTFPAPDLHANPCNPKPNCDFHNPDLPPVPAVYDASLRLRFNGPRIWGYACEECFKARDGKLGTGWGTKL